MFDFWCLDQLCLQCEGKKKTPHLLFSGWLPQVEHRAGVCIWSEGDAFLSTQVCLGHTHFNLLWNNRDEKGMKWASLCSHVNKNSWISEYSTSCGWPSLLPHAFSFLSSFVLVVTMTLPPYMLLAYLCLLYHPTFYAVHTSCSIPASCTTLPFTLYIPLVLSMPLVPPYLLRCTYLLFYPCLLYHPTFYAVHTSCSIPASCITLPFTLYIPLVLSLPLVSPYLLRCTYLLFYPCLLYHPNFFYGIIGL